MAIKKRRWVSIEDTDWRLVELVKQRAKLGSESEAVRRMLRVLDNDLDPDFRKKKLVKLIRKW